jgi:hypothetical protein
VVSHCILVAADRTKEIGQNELIQENILSNPNYLKVSIVCCEHQWQFRAQWLT